MAALRYLEMQKAAQPELAEWYSSMADLFERKLWHQLTQKLEQFVALPVFQAGDALGQLYHNFICDFETKVKGLDVDKNDSLPQMEGLQVKKVKIVVHLHPSRASNVRQGVREILNSLLLRYNEHFEGSVLAHSNTKIQGHTAPILEGLTPYFCVRLTTTFLLFSPKVGLFVEGRVNKVEEDYLGVVVLGLFNAAIGFSDIRNDLVYCEAVDGTKAWISESDERHCISIGSLIRFSVKSVQENEEIVNLTGALTGPQTGCVKYLVLSSKEMDHDGNYHRLSENGEKKPKHKESRSVEEGTNEHTPKKKKKRKETNEAGGDSSLKKR